MGLLPMVEEANPRTCIPEEAQRLGIQPTYTKQSQWRTGDLDVGRVESICVRETESEIIGTLVDTEGTVLVVSIRLWYW